MPDVKALDDLDTDYPIVLNGRKIDELCNLLDLAVRTGGIQAAMIALPLVDILTCQREAAAKAKGNAV